MCGRPQRGVRPMWTEGGWGQKRDFFVDVINGWPLISLRFCIQSFDPPTKSIPTDAHVYIHSDLEFWTC